MSHIPQSAMPHARTHGEHVTHDAPPLTDGPEVKPAAGDAKRDGGGDHGAMPYVAIAAVGALAIGGIVAALALRRPEPSRKSGKAAKGAKPKGRPRKHREEA